MGGLGHGLDRPGGPRSVVQVEAGEELVAASSSTFVTYDQRLLDAAKAAGLPAASPGQN